MKRLFLGAAAAALAVGCASSHPDPIRPTAARGLDEADLAVAGWRIPFECLELSERIETSQSRLYETASGALSTARATDARRLRSLEARADELGCLLPGSPFTY